MGDPAGIGAEVVVAAAAQARVRRACRLVVYGDEGVLDVARRALGRRVAGPTAIDEVVGVTSLPLPRRAPTASRRTAREPAGARGRAKPRTGRPRLPRPSRRAGRAAFAYLEAATAAVLDGRADALVTAPLNKLWLERAGYSYGGHTEYLSEVCGAPATMMLAGRKLRVVLATTHIALADVSRRLSADAIVRAGAAVDAHLRRHHGLARPRLAMAALNPHGGEDGLFGDEERRVLRPAATRLRRRGIEIDGPLPADTLFASAVSGLYDAVLCMYHDQALIPLKLLDFGRAVNVSMGLPIVRTSPDHGTAYEIAGSGKADATSMAEALVLAADMARRAGDA